MSGSASKSNWVCFDCRKSIRRLNHGIKNSKDPQCTTCHVNLVNIGYAIGVPKKTDDKGWKQLKEFIRAKNIAHIESEIQHSVRVIHDLEKEIKIIESREFNRERNRIISKNKVDIAQEKERIQNIG